MISVGYLCSAIITEESVKRLFTSVVAAIISGSTMLAAQAKPNYAEREKNAPSSIKHLLKRIRTDIKRHKLKFTVGYTSALDEPGDPCTIPPSDMFTKARSQNEQSEQVLKRIQRPRFDVCSVSTSTFDWTQNNGVTPIRSSQQCNDCWAFATTAAWEGNYMLRGGTGSVYASEQDLIDCIQGQSCAHADWIHFDQLATGIASETQVLYNPQPANPVNRACSNLNTYRALTSAYVSSQNPVPDPSSIKQALCDHGPLATAIFSTVAFQAYNGGLYSDPNPETSVNHAIVLVGWDDTQQA